MNSLVFLEVRENSRPLDLEYLSPIEASMPRWVVTLSRSLLQDLGELRGKPCWVKNVAPSRAENFLLSRKEGELRVAEGYSRPLSFLERIFGTKEKPSLEVYLIREPLVRVTKNKNKEELQGGDIVILSSTSFFVVRSRGEDGKYRGYIVTYDIPLFRVIFSSYKFNTPEVTVVTSGGIKRFIEHHFKGVLEKWINTLSISR